MPRQVLVAAASVTIALCILFLLDLTSASHAELVPEPEPTSVSVPMAAIALPTEAPTPVPTPPTPKPPRATSTPLSARVISSSRSLNGVAIDQIVVLPEVVKANVRLVYGRGQSLGRNPAKFSKVGDSTMAYPPFLAAFDGSFQLGAYGYLVPTIDRYAGSFGRTSRAVRKGMHTWSEFDPKWVEDPLCAPEEGPLACELRLNNPSIAIIRLGANDVSSPRLFDEQLHRIVRECLAKGIVPVLGTKPDRGEGAANTLNHLIAQAAAEFAIPLWDYDRIAETVPGKGLEKDQVHIRGGGSHDYASPKTFSSGDSLEDLTALMLLDAIRQTVSTPRTQ